MSLRKTVVLLAAATLVISLLLVHAGRVPGWWLLINAAVVLISVLFERRGYLPRARDPGALQPTGERFHDPTTGQLVDVWEDPQTGDRAYRPSAPPPA